jgi:hypothetical protein
MWIHKKRMSFVLVSIVVCFLSGLVFLGCGGGGGDGDAGPSITQPAGPPAPPTNVTAVAGNGQATVTWTASSGATSYNLYYSTVSGVKKGTGTKIAGVISGQVFTDLTNSTTYYFVLTAVNANGESAESVEVSVKPTGPTKAIPEITEILSITLNADARGKYMSTASFTFKETGGAFSYTVTAFQIIYRDQNGAAIGNPQTWDAQNIGLALGNGGRIDAGGTKANWPVVLFWNPPLTALKTDWKATVRDDTGVISTLEGSQSANMPPG